MGYPPRGGYVTVLLWYLKRETEANLNPAFLGLGQQVSRIFGFSRMFCEFRRPHNTLSEESPVRNSMEQRKSPQLLYRLPVLSDVHKRNPPPTCKFPIPFIGPLKRFHTGVQKKNNARMRVPASACPKLFGVVVGCSSRSAYPWTSKHSSRDTKRDSMA